MLKNEKLCNIGNKWTQLEEMLLIDELSENISIDEIAKNHGRTVGGIKSRCKDIAYKLYRQNKPIEEITMTTKLSETDVINHIKARQYKSKMSIDKKTQNHSEIQIDHMKNDINQIKNSLKEIFGMIQAIYEFEDR
mgnify:CR=1 FL=1|tara:strand:- start:21186 stop:21593 length:408 start_codon:yes stop_codon:yes gene_type:complete